jgi:response regulator RpfG family c-di-GMP phosphodiesterase
VTGQSPTSASSKAQPAGMRILDKLRDDGRITASQYESLYHHARRSGEPVQEAILDGGVMTETELLKFVAGIYQTRFVSTERLAKADLDRELLTLVPRKLAERLFVCPILFDKRAQLLSIVVTDLEEDLGKQVQLVTNVREVRPYIARPASIRAAIRKHYGGDPQAFVGIAGAALPSSPADVIDRHDGGGLSLGSLGIGRGGADAGLDIDGLGGGLGGFNPPTAKLDPARMAPKAPPRAAALDLGRLEMPTFEAPKEPLGSLVETAAVLVSLIEQTRAELRGHSAMVARICVRAADRLSMSDTEKEELRLAAYLHDLGKHATYHLTAFNVSRFDGHRMQAEKTWGAPLKLFEPARLSAGVRAILEGLHERWDGKGFPNQLAGKDIPMGARVLAVAETYADLVANPKNPYRRTLTRQEALDVIRQLAGQLFDPALLDVLRIAGGSEGTLSGSNRQRVLIVEPDAAEATVLELRFADQGWDAAVATERADAVRLIEAERFDLVISEVDLGAEDGFTLAAALRASPKSKDAALVFLTKRADRDSVNKGFSAGAADYLQKPTAPEVVVAKAAQIVEVTSKKKAAAGLSGSLKDMGLPEVVQVLGQGRKNGQLRVSSSVGSGEMHFDAGNIVHALFGKHRGGDAFYAMLLLKDGDFAFDPNVKSTERTLNASTESLLLEGMRRIDEGLVG